MSKRVPDAIIDAMLTAARGTTIHLCSADPVNYAGIAAVQLGSQALAGSHTLNDGDTNGRKNTTPQQTGFTPSVAGTATHVVESDGASEIRKQTTCTPQAVTDGIPIDIPAYDHEIGDAT